VVSFPLRLGIGNVISRPRPYPRHAGVTDTVSGVSFGIWAACGSVSDGSSSHGLERSSSGGSQSRQKAMTLARYLASNPTTPHSAQLFAQTRRLWRCAVSARIWASTYSHQLRLPGQLKWLMQWRFRVAAGFRWWRTCSGSVRKAIIYRSHAFRAGWKRPGTSHGGDGADAEDGGLQAVHCPRSA